MIERDGTRRDVRLVERLDQLLRPCTEVEVGPVNTLMQVKREDLTPVAIFQPI